MAIPEDQLNVWSGQGSVTNSASTGNSVKTALEAYRNFSAGISFEVFLQGSYKNTTNIYGESDVDVTVMLNNSFYSNLTSEQKAHFGLTSAPYAYTQFRNDVQLCLNSYFGVSNVEAANKVFKIAPSGNRIKTDVLTCFAYRHYYNATQIDAFHPGVSFFAQQDNRQIINFPKRHSENCTLKHQATNEWFKPTVRIFKNIKCHLVNNGFDGKKAPSYFIECLLGNIPNENFGQDYQSTVINCVNYIINNSIDNFYCLNGIRPLWGAGDEYWDQNDANVFISELIKLWNNW